MLRRRAGSSLLISSDTARAESACDLQGQGPRKGYVYTCTCMYVCMHACMHVCMYTCMYVRMHGCMYVCTYVCMYVCMYVSMYVCVYICMYTNIQICANKQHILVRVYLCIYTYIYVYTHIYIYRYMNLAGIRPAKYTAKVLRTEKVSSDFCQESIPKFKNLAQGSHAI